MFKVKRNLKAIIKIIIDFFIAKIKSQQNLYVIQVHWNYFLVAIYNLLNIFFLLILSSFQCFRNNYTKVKKTTHAAVSDAFADIPPCPPSETSDEPHSVVGQYDVVRQISQV